MDSLDPILRLFAATAVGMALGLNRDLEGKPLGIRTLGLVAMSAALVALAITGIAGIAESPDALARVIQGVVVGALTGVGFIGSGVILRHPERGTVENLTTAATTWATAALGLAAALASWMLFALAAALTFILLALEHRFERFIHKKAKR